MYSTTLMYAAEKGHVEIVEYLLDIGHEEEVISVVNARKIKDKLVCVWH